MIIKCKTCGLDFEATKPHQKYCCEACRIAGKKQTRAAWISRTNWREKDAAKHREKAAEKRAQKLEAEAAREQEEAEERRRRVLKHKAERKAKEAAGDHIALMLKALESGGKFNADYWKAYAAAVLEYSDKSGGECTATVNGISVLKEDFPALVVESIKESGCIITAAGSY